MKILVIKLGALGDVVRTTAILTGLARRFSPLEITWVSARQARPLLQGDPLIGRVVCIDDAPEAHWRCESYDWVISLDDEPGACELASRLRASQLSGGFLDDGGQPAYTGDLEEWFGMGVLRPESQGGLDRANDLKRANRATHPEILYSCLGLPPPRAHPRLFLREGDQRFASDWLATHGDPTRRWVGLNTGAGTRWRFKSWGEEQTVELARRLAQLPELGVLVLGGPEETERNRRIAAAIERPNVVLAPTGLELLRFAALVGCCEVLFTSDSLAMHFGIATSVRIVAFFGPTSHAEIDLYELGEKLVTPLPCRCCYLKDCDVRPHCMESIPVTRAYDAILRQLQAGGSVATSAAAAAR
jgi:heptosyltransferase-2